ncbi:MAG: hypothetical protein ACK4MV_13050 [Beijerinckiaceae bacterium]
MNLTNQQIRKLESIISAAQAILTEAKASTNGKSAKPKRVRRSGKDLVAFRKMLVAERKKGVPVAELARKHNISSAYIYQL